MAKKPTSKGTAKKAAPSAAKPKTEKKPATKKAAAEAPKPKFEADPELRKAFLVHKDNVFKLHEAAKKAHAKYRAALADAKRDGYTKKQFDVAFLLDTPEGEAEYKARVANELLVAQYVGADIGQQLSLFLTDDMPPIGDRAFKEGEKAAMENRAATTDYSPGTEAFDKFMEGYHSVTDKRVKDGIKKLETKGSAEKPPRRARAAAPEPVEEDDLDPPMAPASGVAMTRSQFERTRAAAGGGTETTFFTKRTEPAGTA